ncbi:hypothetical protein JCM21900_000121 [Sporobolomyces salmonicolor]
MPLRSRAPIGPEASAVPTTTKVSRFYNEPIGPPTELVAPGSFARQAHEVLKKAEAKAQAIETGWTKLGRGEAERLRERCSVDDLYEENAKLYSDDYVKVELKRWHEARLFPHAAPNRKGRKRKADEEDGFAEEDGEDGTPQPESTADKVQLELDPELAKVVDEANHSPLNLLKAPNASYFVRKTRLPDLNILAAIRTSELNDLDPATTTADPLSNLVYTITFHPIPRIIGKVASTPQRQVLVCLGSTTLWQLRANLLVGGDNMPAEAAPSAPTEPNEEEDNEDDAANDSTADGTNEMYGGVKLESFFGGGVLPEEQANVRWTQERRVTGAAFAAEGVLYPDQGGGKTDYAQMILQSIDSVDWPPLSSEPTATRVTPPPRGSSGSETPAPSGDISVSPSLAHALDPDLPRSSTGSPFASSLAHQLAQESTGSSTDSSKPQFQAGPAMQETKVGRMPLRVGQPYWYVHQGNAEHVWTVDEIRYRHPSDPSPSTTAYPITTYLSRSLASKCRICDRDPGELVVVNDELAGESPGLVCQACFELLHPLKERETGERRGAEDRGEEREFMDGVQVVPTILER